VGATLAVDARVFGLGVHSAQPRVTHLGYDARPALRIGLGDLSSRKMGREAALDLPMRFSPRSKRRPTRSGRCQVTRPRPAP
jgi:hypothetical protein